MKIRVLKNGSEIFEAWNIRDANEFFDKAKKEYPSSRIILKVGTKIKRDSNKELSNPSKSKLGKWIPCKAVKVTKTGVLVKR